MKAHKFIISSSSPILRNILKLNSNPHPLIYLRGVKYSDLKSLINFMYQGELNIAEEDLKVKGLSEENEKYKSCEME